MSQICNSCNTIYQDEAKFCTNCGKSLVKRAAETRAESLNSIIVFYVIFLVYAVVSYFLYSEYPTSLGVEIGLESVFALLVICFSLIDYKNILRLYKIPYVNWKIIFFSFIFPVFSALTVYFFTDYTNSFLFDSETDNYYLGYIYLENPMFWAILFIAITPPIFEELAFRGFLFNQLQKVVSERVTIIATAFIFALVHFSFISLLWIFPFGIVLGYLRSKYNTLWYGIIIHFIHNFLVLMMDYYFYNSSLSI